MKINQDANLYISVLDPGKKIEFAPAPQRHVWLQMTRGNVKVNGSQIKAGDGAAASEEKSLSIEALEPSEILLFDLS